MVAVRIVFRQKRFRQKRTFYTVISVPAQSVRIITKKFRKSLIETSMQWIIFIGDKIKRILLMEFYNLLMGSLTVPLKGY